jgi:hypothetical protein
VNKIVGYISLYFGKKELSDYPGLLKKSEQRNLDNVIIRASYSVLFDTDNEPRSIDWRAL